MNLKQLLRLIIQVFAWIWISIWNFFTRKVVKKRIKQITIFTSVCLLLLLGAWLFFRNSVLDKAWKQAQQKLEQKGYTLQCKEKGFEGLFTVAFSNLQLQQKESVLFSSQRTALSVDLWNSIWNGPTIGSIELKQTRISAINDKNGCNYCGLIERNTRKKQSKDPLVQRMFSLVKGALAKIPGTITLADFNAYYRDSSNQIGVEIPMAVYDGDDIQGTLRIAENDHKNGFLLSGVLDRGDITGKLLIKPENKSWAELPFLKRIFGVSAGFGLADFTLDKFDMNGGILNIEASGKVERVTVNDKRLADTNVIVRECKGTLIANLGKDFVEIDSNTKLSLNKINTFLYARAAMGKEKVFDLKFKSERIAANDFFNSLPEGMFHHLESIKASGELEYEMAVHLEDKKPFDCTFYSSLKPYNFKITSMGNTDLEKMNRAFKHTFYERGKPVRSFMVGPSNPSFTPLDQIPEIIQKAVMTGEDPAFFSHNGFYAEAIRQSIAQNYVRKRFARGGSTISMQLVKNVFLSRKKTLARKAEEILIVWLIESQKITSKSRMLEVYLNIIEWGPGVFGIGEASQFYFTKSPAGLEPLECAFLASIVPMPKSYAYFLDSAGYVSKKNWNFVAIRNNMIKRGDISESDTASFNVKITGPAIRGLRRAKVKDSSISQENELLLDLGQ